MEVRRRVMCLWLTFGFSVAILSPQMLDLSVDICGLYYNCSHPYPSEEELERHIQLKNCFYQCGCNTANKAELLCPGQEELRTCANPSIYSASSLKRDGKIIPMIEKCFEEANDTMKDLCSNARRDPLNLDSYVVTGVRKGMHFFFRNMYCFHCNNGNNLERLHLEVKYCEAQSFDVNTYSSVSELLYHVEKASCEFGYTTGFQTYCAEPSAISECNVTGQWDVWSEEVNAACSTYEGKFLVFKNIFCYACNTGVSGFSPSIRSCTNHEDVRFELECLNGPANPRTFPYWNEYCRKCNELPGVSYVLHHVNIYNKSAEYPFEGSVYFRISFCDLRNSDAYKFLTLSPTIEYWCNFAYRRFTHIELESSFDLVYSTFITNNKKSVNDVNWTDLYDEYLRLGGKEKWWGGADEECSYESSCYALQNCCPEVLGNNALECRDMDGQNVTTVTSCPYLFSEKAWKYYCERSESEMLTILDMFPFFGKNDAYYPYFRNVFCQMCNKLAESLPSVESGDYIHFKCKKYIDIDNFLPLLNSLSILGDTCVLEYKSLYSNEPPSCSLESYRFDKDAGQCSLPDNSALVNTGMKYMCEKTGPYIFSTCKKKYVNIFCEMCTLHSECERANRSCTIGASVQNNQLCYLPDPIRKPGIEPFEPMKFDLNISFISRYNTTNVTDNLTRSCTDLEYYDVAMGSCRKIKCSPGRIYHNGDCSGLFLSYTNMIFYKLAAKITFKDVESRSRIQLNELVNGLTDTLFTMYHKSIIEYHVTVDIHCTSEKVLESVNQFHMFIHLVFVRYHASRNNLDAEYLALLNTQLKIRSGRFRATIVIESDWRSSYLSKLIHFGFPFYYCKEFYLNSSRFEFGYRSGVHIFKIDKFLLCPQISLNHTEYHILDGSNKLRLQCARKANALLDYTEENNDDVRVCLMDYDNAMSSSSEKGIKINTAVILNVMYVWSFLLFFVHGNNFGER